MLHSDRRKLERGWLRIPYVGFAAPDDAIESLREHGFTGRIDVTTYESRYRAGRPSGRVSYTRPAAGTIIDPARTIELRGPEGEAKALTDRERELDAKGRDKHDRWLAAQDGPARLAVAPGETPPNVVVPRPAAQAVLSDDLIGRFVERCRAIGVDVPSGLAPGLTDEEIDERLPPGFVLPEEARRWWRWHDGTVTTSYVEFIPARQALSLDGAIEGWELNQYEHLEMWGIGGLVQPFNWVPHIYFECLGPPDDPVPIYAQQDIEDHLLALASIGEMLLAFIELIDCGAWSWTGSEWEVDDDRLPGRLADVGFY
jgi:hypothetical protein